MARPSIRKYIQSSGSTILVVVQRDKVVVVRWWPGPDASWLSPPQSSKLHTLSSASLCWAVHCSHWQPVHCSHWQDCTVHTGNLWTVKLLPLSWAVLSIIWQLTDTFYPVHTNSQTPLLCWAGHHFSQVSVLHWSNLIWSDGIIWDNALQCNMQYAWTNTRSISVELLSIDERHGTALNWIYSTKCFENFQPKNICSVRRRVEKTWQVDGKFFQLVSQLRAKSSFYLKRRGGENVSEGVVGRWGHDLLFWTRFTFKLHWTALRGANDSLQVLSLVDSYASAAEHTVHFQWTSHLHWELRGGVQFM